VNVASILGKLWTLPNTALGLAVGAVAVILGARAQAGRNAIEFLDQPFVGLLGKSAITLGNTIHYAPGRGPEHACRRYDGRAHVNLGAHERAHTLQYERWGPLFLVVYAVSWLPFVPPAGNRFEHAADDAAERDEA
jgi:membrane protein YqaA with SNARE-associated domain